MDLVVMVEMEELEIQQQEPTEPAHLELIIQQQLPIEDIFKQDLVEVVEVLIEQEMLQ